MWFKKQKSCRSSPFLNFDTMKIKLLCIGKTSKSFLVDGEAEYLKRLKHYVSVEKIEFPDIRNAKKKTEAQIKEEEGQLILSKCLPQDHLILLDENGKQFGSEGFAEHLQKLYNGGMKQLVFIIGGAYGFSEELYAKAQGKISISKMTFSHQMIRMIFLEQLYRAHTIMKGEPYHHR